MTLVSVSVVEPLLDAVVKARLAGVGGTLRNRVMLVKAPTRASRSPSPSMSTMLGDPIIPALLSPKGLVPISVKLGAVAVPTLR
nr:hypothetical protein [Azospirillum brasilense]